MDLEALWDRKEYLRNEWRNNREDVVSQIRFGKAQKEWEETFIRVLKDNAIDIYKSESFDTVYKSTENGLVLSKQEFINKLNLIMDKELVKKIMLDLD